MAPPPVDKFKASRADEEPQARTGEPPAIQHSPRYGDQGKLRDGGDLSRKLGSQGDDADAHGGSRGPDLPEVEKLLDDADRNQSARLDDDRNRHQAGREQPAFRDAGRTPVTEAEHDEKRADDEVEQIEPKDEFGPP